MTIKKMKKTKQSFRQKKTMKTSKYCTGIVTLFALTINSVALADLNPMGDLEITMEVVDETSESTADIVNRIELPAQLRERARQYEQARTREENGERPEDVIGDGREMAQEMENYREEVHEQHKEQQADALSDVREQSQSMRGSRELIEDAREQQADHIDDVRKKNQQNRR